MDDLSGRLALLLVATSDAPPANVAAILDAHADAGMGPNLLAFARMARSIHKSRQRLMTHLSRGRRLRIRNALQAKTHLGYDQQFGTHFPAPLTLMKQRYQGCCNPS